MVPPENNDVIETVDTLSSSESTPYPVATQPPPHLSYLNLSPRHGGGNPSEPYLEPVSPSFPSYGFPSPSFAVSGFPPSSFNMANVPASPLTPTSVFLTQVTALHAAVINGKRQELLRLLSECPCDAEVRDKFGRTPLMYAVLGDRSECVYLLLKHGVKVEATDNSRRTALHFAAHKGYTQCVKLLLNGGASWRWKDQRGVTALHLATRHTSSKSLLLLLKHVAPGEVDDQDNNKRTPLHWSAAHGNPENVRLLMRHDSNIGIPDVEGKTPLHWAASCKGAGAVICVKILLEAAPSVIRWQDYEGRTALHLGVADGNEDIVSMLVSVEKCNIDALDNMFRTPLHWAALLGKANIVSLLLDKKASYASTDANGATPLHYAAHNNSADTVEVFMRHRHVHDKPDADGQTALMWAAGKGANDVIRALCQHKADLFSMDKNKSTALHIASLLGLVSTVELLTQLRAPIDAANYHSHTPLFHACEMGHGEVAKVLISAGASLNHRDRKGCVVLHWAAMGGHAYLTHILVKAGMDPNVCDYSGRSPLHMASYGGYVDCMAVLLESYANVNHQDNEDMSALHWAATRGHLDAVRLLFEHSAYPNLIASRKDRLTALDCALFGEHNEISQCIIENGGLSVACIKNIAATRIQAHFRGYLLRKGFQQRKQLLVKHEQLRREASRKRSGSELSCQHHALGTCSCCRNSNIHSSECSQECKRKASEKLVHSVISEIARGKITGEVCEGCSEMHPGNRLTEVSVEEGFILDRKKDGSDDQVTEGACHFLSHLLLETQKHSLANRDTQNKSVGISSHIRSGETSEDSARDGHAQEKSVCKTSEDIKYRNEWGGKLSQSKDSALDKDISICSDGENISSHRKKETSAGEKKKQPQQRKYVPEVAVVGKGRRTKLSNVLVTPRKKTQRKLEIPDDILNELNSSGDEEEDEGERRGQGLKTHQGSREKDCVQTLNMQKGWDESLKNAEIGKQKIIGGNPSGWNVSEEDFIEGNEKFDHGKVDMNDSVHTAVKSKDSRKRVQFCGTCNNSEKSSGDRVYKEEIEKGFSELENKYKANMAIGKENGHSEEMSASASEKKTTIFMDVVNVEGMDMLRKRSTRGNSSTEPKPVHSTASLSSEARRRAEGEWQKKMAIASLQKVPLSSIVSKSQNAEGHAQHKTHDSRGDADMNPLARPSVFSYNMQQAGKQSRKTTSKSHTPRS